MNISQIIDDQLTILNESEKRKHKSREPGIFYASEAMQCPRKIYISIMHPDKISKKMPLGLFKMAKHAEESIISCLRSTPGIILEEQIGLKYNVSPKVMIHGYIDFALLNDNGKITEIYEIKSIGNISYISKSDTAKLHHRSQLQCYLQNKQCDKGGIIYAERGDILKIKQFNDTLDSELWKRIKEHFTLLSDTMDDKKIPLPIPIESWECRYCEFNDDCKVERKKLKIKL